MFTDRCIEGEIRLVGGVTDNEGRVEVCTSYFRWGTVCNKQWTMTDTKVVCQQLGYSDTEGIGNNSVEEFHTYIIMSYIIYIYIYIYIYTGSYETHTFDAGTYPIVMDYVNCNGSEVRLWDCVHFTHSYSGCEHSHDVGVRCQPGIYIIVCIT